MKMLFFCFIVFSISLLIAGLLLRYSLANNLMDVPNGRSSHTISTPRGGGLAIVISFLAMTGFLGHGGYITAPVATALLGSGGCLAVIGFLDDHGHIPARWRLLGHFTAAAWALFWLGGMPPLNIWGQQFQLGWAGYVVAALYLVWLLNLYNFMDGIDGIASVEAICVCGGAALLYLLANVGTEAWLPLTLAAAVGGFLLWNFPPAEIFMGDAGSGFLGIVLGILSIQAAWVSSALFYSWVVLLGVFVVDATFTLMRRVARGDKPYEAHRSHGYQFASRRYGSHLPVTLGVAAINIFWLLPISLAIVLFGLDGPAGIVIAYSPLFGLAIYFKAGSIERG